MACLGRETMIPSPLFRRVREVGSQAAPLPTGPLSPTALAVGSPPSPLSPSSPLCGLIRKSATRLQSYCNPSTALVPGREQKEGRGRFRRTTTKTSTNHPTNQQNTQTASKLFLFQLLRNQFFFCVILFERGVRMNTKGTISRMSVAQRILLFKYRRSLAPLYSPRDFRTLGYFPRSDRRMFRDRGRGTHSVFPPLAKPDAHSFHWHMLTSMHG